MTSPRSANIKLFLFIGAILIVIATLVYTQHIVHLLLAKERKVAGLYANSLEFIVNRPTNQDDYSFIFNEIIRSIDFPMILSDEDNHPLPDYRLNTTNIDFDTTLTQEQQRRYLEHVIQTLDQINSPIKVVLKVTTQDSILQYIHYGESSLIQKLRWLPYIEFGVAGMFLLLAYVGFSYIKRNEQSNIWVGMAKETAHQLGTPLSSLMGWLEMMKAYAVENPKQLTTISEMEHDLLRLQKVTDRFSKIGSKPVLKDEDLNEVIGSVINYFKQRLPSRFAQGKQIDISISTHEQIQARINRELFEWVIENLIKNALDAMEDPTGTITFDLSVKGSTVYIDVKDTGKGLDMKYKKDIFRPGYSTKKRGWGLGLSLSKRIIETYHRGRLFVKESRIGQGTTFRLKIPQ
jgi:signal transduction histidine kinase